MTTGQPHPHRPPGLRYPQITGSAQPNPTGGPGSAEFASARLSARNGKTERRRSALSRRFAAQPPINSPRHLRDPLVRITMHCGRSVNVHVAAKRVVRLQQPTLHSRRYAHIATN
jgi:hypothetical protein